VSSSTKATIRIVAEHDAERRAAICRDLLGRLPDWFAIPESVEKYIDEVRSRAMSVALDENDTILGFVTLERVTPVAAELHLIAVLPSLHRRGVGRALLAWIEAAARAQGAAMLLVKTLAPSVEYEPYAATREFYRTCGFVPLAVFPDMWDPEDPCLLMGKSLA
jgi:GNAT superfamily N-acetyltransferase